MQWIFELMKTLEKTFLISVARKSSLKTKIVIKTQKQRISQKSFEIHICSLIFRQKFGSLFSALKTVQITKKLKKNLLKKSDWAIDRLSHRNNPNKRKIIFFNSLFFSHKIQTRASPAERILQRPSPVSTSNSFLRY